MNDVALLTNPMQLIEGMEYLPGDPAFMDQLEARIVEIGGAVQGKGEQLPEFPLRHLFIPAPLAMYVRDITMPPGWVVSRIHKTEHPFSISKGKVSVLIQETGEVEHLKAPHLGITFPGTRRFLVIHEETVWTTFHITAETDLMKLDDELWEPHLNPLLLEEETS